MFITLGELFVVSELSNKLWPWVISEQVLIFTNMSVTQMNLQCMLSRGYYKYMQYKCTGTLPATIYRLSASFPLLFLSSRESDGLYEFQAVIAPLIKSGEQQWSSLFFGEPRQYCSL